MSSIPSITVEELKARQDAGCPPFLVDVREPRETAYAAIDGAVSIPLATLPANLDKLPKEGDIVIFCHHGGRSAQATMFLAARGFANVFNLEGGIDDWSRTVDPSVRRY